MYELRHVEEMLKTDVSTFDLPETLRIRQSKCLMKSYSGKLQIQMERKMHFSYFKEANTYLHIGH